MPPPSSPSNAAPTQAATSETQQRLMTKDAVLRASSKLRREGKLDTTDRERETHHDPSLPPSSSLDISSTTHRTVLSAFFFVVGNLAKVVIHFGLFILVLAMAAVHCIRTVHDEYFVALVRQAEVRGTPTALQDQFTYYNRQCNVLDLTATPPYYGQYDDDDGTAMADLWVDPSKCNSLQRATTRAVGSVMRHGTVMIPQLLQDSTIGALRDDIIRKNDAVMRGETTTGVHTLRKNRNRISVALEPTEDDAIIQALQELHDHKLLGRVVKTLLGDPNPALVEITAITARFGASDQPWHTDTKSDGNALLYGRSYEHSYSLYVPLQNVTRRMGPTDMCLATHYCADSHLIKLCDEHKIGLHEVRPVGSATEHDIDGSTGSRSHSHNRDKIWRQGDGVLFNQQIWHRGGQHRDKQAPDRVVFVVSFVSRPTTPRQLARGMSYHQRWMNWGATWEDMADSGTSMARPWSILRSLHLWKASNRQWGYDLITSSAMRIANNEPGMQGADLARFIDDVLVPWKFPHFLYGTVNLTGTQSWQLFLRTTLDNCYTFCQALNVAGHTAFAVLLLLTGLVVRSRPNGGFLVTIRRGLFRLFCTHGLVIAGTLYTMHAIHNSKWAKGIKSGETLMLPFPKVEGVLRSDDPMVSSGRTTFPQRFDVLVGTRLNAKYLGSYRKWLDYHPGNMAFNAYVNQYGGQPYHAILRGESIPKTLSDGVAQTSTNLIERSNMGRFLYQDYRSGDWRVMNTEERMEYVHMRLFVGGPETLWSALKDEIDIMLDSVRFGFKARGERSLSWYSQLYLSDLGRTLFMAWPRRIDIRKREKILQRKFLSYRGNKITIMALSLPRAKLRKVPGDGSQEKSHRNISAEPDGLQSVSQWDEVDVYDRKRDQFFWGTVFGVSNAKHGCSGYDVAMYGIGVKKMGEVQRDIPRSELVLRNHVVEGDKVYANFALKGKFYPAFATLVVADGSIDVEYTDGDVELNVALYNYLPHNTTV